MFSDHFWGGQFGLLSYFHPGIAAVILGKLWSYDIDNFLKWKGFPISGLEFLKKIWNVLYLQCIVPAIWASGFLSWPGLAFHFDNSDNLGTLPAKLQHPRRTDSDSRYLFLAGLPIMTYGPLTQRRCSSPPNLDQIKSYWTLAPINYHLHSIKTGDKAMTTLMSYLLSLMICKTSLCDPVTLVC